MTTIKDYLDYAELAQAAYGNLTALFSPNQLTRFEKHYKTLATSQQYGIGNISNFQATLFLDTTTGNKVLAIRGSQEFTDYVVDIEELALHGTIISQTSSMEDFYQALINDGKLSATEHIDVTGHSLGGFLGLKVPGDNYN